MALGVNEPDGATFPAQAKRVPPLRGAWWKWAAGLLMCYVIYGAFFIAGGAVNFGKSGNPARIVFFHVPVAILSSVGYFVAAYYAFRVLTQPAWTATDLKSAISMELGILFCLLATVTGSIFAGVQWNSFWNWDPREISIVGLLLLYVAYFVLRAAAADQPNRRTRLCAVYTLVTLAPAVFMIWVVPRIPALLSLHPTDTLIKPQNTSGSYKAVLYPSFLAFTLVFVWLFQLRLRALTLMSRPQPGGTL